MNSLLEKLGDGFYRTDWTPQKEASMKNSRPKSGKTKFGSAY